MDLEKVGELLGGREGRPEQLIEILQDLQATFRYLPKDGLRLVAEQLGVPEIEVYRVASFYKAFSLEPKGRHVFTVCTGTACHVRGSPRLMDALSRELGIAPGETTADGAFTLEGVNCLGCCALGPVVLLDGAVHDHVTAAKLKKLIAATRAQEATHA